jgi:SAM-dependent methyltransferase
MSRFADVMELDDGHVVADLGGTPHNWQYLDVDPRVLLCNLDPAHDGAAKLSREMGFWFVRGDAAQAPVRTEGVDIVFSNSLIEHLHTWDAQRRFADEVRRSGKRFWVQTPAREFFLEPHLLAPFIHWLPKKIQRRLIRFTPWALLYKPTAQHCDAMLEELRLLRRNEFEQLFPEADIVVQRWMGMPKSYVAYRA